MIVGLNRGWDFYFDKNKDEKVVVDIMSSQLDDKTFRQYCRVVIDNSNDLSSTKEQIENILKKMAD